MSMFTTDAYNKYNKNVRIGNWVEEIALEQITGSQRRPNEKGIAPRTVEHLEQLLPKYYISNTHATHDDPLRHTDYIPVDRLPPRQGMQEQTRMNTARNIVTDSIRFADTKKEVMTLESTNRSAFVSYDKSAFAKPVRRTQDLVPTKIDPRIMADHDLRLLPPTRTDDELKKSLPAGGLVDSVPVTVYSQRLSEHLYAGTSSDLKNPFEKSSKITNDYNDGTKSHCYHVDFKKQYHTGTLDHPTHYAGSDLTVHPLIEAYRDRLIEIVGPSGLSGVISKFITINQCDNKLMDRSKFHTALIDLGLSPHQSDIQVFFAELDPKKTGYIDYTRFFDLFIKPMNQERQNALEKAFNFLDKDHQGYLTLPYIFSQFIPYQYFSVKENKEFPSKIISDFKSTWNVEDEQRVTLDEFMSYFCSLSYLMRDDKKFVQNIYNIFNIPSPKPPQLRKIHMYDIKGQPHPYEFVDDENIGSDPILIQAYLRQKLGFTNIDYVKVLN